MRRTWATTTPPAAAVLVALAAAFSGCSCSDFMLAYTGLAFTPDGQRLVLDSTEGLFIASPPDATPNRLIGRGCSLSDSATGGVGCVRFSPDSSRMAALFPRDGEPLLRDLQQFFLTGTGGDSDTPLMSMVPGAIASDAVDAAFTPDGRELVWAAPTGEDGVVRLMRLKGDGSADLQVPTVKVGATSMSGAMGATVLTRYGIAFPRSVGDATELWFKPFDDTSFQIGTLQKSCGGTQLQACAMVSKDGGTLAWQEDSSGILALFVAQTQALLPLGQAWGFAFTRSGRYSLRIDYKSVVVQNVETAVVVRRIAGATAAQISADGETLAWLVPESSALKSMRLFGGSSRAEGSDHDLDVYEGPDVRPLNPGALGDADLDLAMTGDALWAVLATKGSQPGAAKLVSVGLASGERVELGEMTCKGCCAVADAGALLACIAQDAASGARVVQLFDPRSGTQSSVTINPYGAQFLFDGRGVAVLGKDGSGDAVFDVALKDGRLLQYGSAFDFAISPANAFVAWLSGIGSLKVQRLPP